MIKLERERERRRVFSRPRFAIRIQRRQVFSVTLPAPAPAMHFLSLCTQHDTTRQPPPPPPSARHKYHTHLLAPVKKTSKTYRGVFSGPHSDRAIKRLPFCPSVRASIRPARQPQPSMPTQRNTQVHIAHEILCGDSLTVLTITVIYIKENVAGCNTKAGSYSRVRLIYKSMREPVKRINIVRP